MHFVCELNLDERPQDFSIDCLNIIPISIIAATRDVLLARGHSPDIIDQKLKGTIFHGDRTELTIDGQPLKPWHFGDSWNDAQQKYLRFSTPIQGLKANVPYTNTEGIVPSKISINKAVTTGDLLYASSKAVAENDFGNGDSQNAIILNNSSANVPRDPIQVFTHRTNVKERRSTIGKVFKMLCDEALKRGMSPEEYVQKGGIEFDIAQFDYPGFYATLAKSLGTKKTSLRARVQRRKQIHEKR